MREIEVGKNDAGQRLDRFLSKALPALPEALLQKYIRLKRIKLNGAKAMRDTRLKIGDILTLYINDEFFQKPDNKSGIRYMEPRELDVLYEDENIMLVNKPAGLLCHPDSASDLDTLIAHIQARAIKKGEWDEKSEHSFAPALCNRIDRGTGGIVIAAKNAAALRIMNEKIKNREIDKYYLCAILGEIKPEAGTLSGDIFKDARQNRVYIRSVPGSKPAVTEYRTVAKKEGLSLIECRLITGRTHQIRAQFANAGHPLLGDGKYGVEKTNRAYGEKRQALFAYRVDFSFRTPAGELNYLRGRSFRVSRVDFAEKYFGFADGERGAGL